MQYDTGKLLVNPLVQLFGCGKFVLLLPRVNLKREKK